MKKAVLTVLMTVLITAFAGVAHAFYVDGMVSGAPATIGQPSVLPSDMVSSVNPGHMGDYLIYSYYNVRNGNLNMFSVVNTDPTNGQKIRVVFRSAKTSKECLDFSVCLSKGDRWDGYLFDTGVATIFTDAVGLKAGIDNDTITAPIISASGVGFISGSYKISTIDPTVTDSPWVVTDDDCKEGYFEMAGMSKIPWYDKNASSTSSCLSATSATNCLKKLDMFSPNAVDVYDNCDKWKTTYDVPNVLFGSSTIIEMATLSQWAYNATAIANTTNIGWDLVSGGAEPNLPFAMNTRTTRLADSSCDEAEYILMKNKVYSAYDLVSNFAGETEFTFTFPTRLACHANSTFLGAGEQTNLFDGKVKYKTPTAAGTTDSIVWKEYCTHVMPSLWDWKENTPPGQLAFSPSNPGSFCLPYELNVIKLGASNQFNSTVAKTITPMPSGFTLGWINFDLRDYQGTSATDNHWVVYPINRATGLVSAGATFAGINFGLPGIYNTAQSYGGKTSYMIPMAYDTLSLVLPVGNVLR